ncbi:RcnB family protein [Hydrocarboniphaga sp.]|uniref:RcnB family protein n=1 Tax=Hydrocarboniphaga sp. TaxID=2033016 RepID=UPI003D142932
MSNKTFNKTAFAAALLAALAVSYSGSSSARDDDHHGRPDQSQWNERHDDRHDDHRDDHHDDHHDNRNDHRGPPQRYHVTRYYPPRGYQPRNWDRGQRLPANYRVSKYVVYDYQKYRLHSPPRGYRWVRVNNDVLLITISNGMITERVGGLFY